MANNKQIFISYIIESRTNAIEDDDYQITREEIHIDQLKEFDLPEVFKTRIFDHYRYGL